MAAAVAAMVDRPHLGVVDPPDFQRMSGSPFGPPGRTGKAKQQQRWPGQLPGRSCPNLDLKVVHGNRKPPFVLYVNRVDRRLQRKSIEETLPECQFKIAREFGI